MCKSNIICSLISHQIPKTRIFKSHSLNPNWWCIYIQTHVGACMCKYTYIHIYMYIFLLSIGQRSKTPQYTNILLCAVYWAA